METQVQADNSRPMIELPSHEFLSELALNDPQAYETLRSELINRFINSAPAEIKSRLLGIQFQVDGIRQISKSTLGSTLGVYKLMWQSFDRLNQVWHEFNELKSNCTGTHGKMPVTEPLPVRNAKILEFRQRQARD
jgi:hypothetical protein